MKFLTHLLLTPLALLATSAQAWTFTPGAICMLDHQAPDVTVALTYDPSKPLYTISLKRDARFPAGVTFALAFEGPFPITIATDRQVLTERGTLLTVTDLGFGNVLDGLQFNTQMRATIGKETLIISLAGAADPVAAFRICEASLPVA